MKQTIKSILAFAALMLCGGAWAAAANKQDESGTVPTYWLEFNDNFDSSGSQEISWGSSEKNNNFADVGITGRDKAMKVVDGSTHPYSSNTSTQYLGNGNFTFTLVAKTVRVNNANKIVLASIGETGGFVGFYAKPEGNTVYFGSKDKVYLTAEVPTATLQYHSYLVTKEGSTLTLYVDGVAVDSTGSAPNCNLGGCQIGAVRGGAPDGFARVTGSFIDDVRIYQGTVLDQEKITAFANAYAVGPAFGADHTATISSNVNFTQAGWDVAWENASANSVTINVTEDCTLTVNEARTIGGLILNVAPGKTLTLTGTQTMTVGTAKLIGGGTIKLNNTNGFTPLGATTPVLDIAAGSTLQLENTANWSYASVDFRSITGTGSIKLTSTNNSYQLLPPAANMWATTLAVINEINNSNYWYLGSANDYVIGTFSGSGNISGQNTGTSRTLKVVQSANSEWSGHSSNDSGSHRFTKFTVAGAQGAVEKTLTFSGDNGAYQANLEVEASGSLKLTGTWRGKGNVAIAGEFGGTGSLTTDASGDHVMTAVTFASGAKIRADWGAVTLGVAPTFGGMTEVVAASIPNDGVKLFSIAGTASETSLGAVCFNVGGTLSKGKIVTKADGIYAVAEEGDVLAGKLRYHYDFNGNFTNNGDEENKPSLSNAKTAITSQQAEGSLKMSADPGNYYSNNPGGFSYGEGDWTIVAIVKAPGVNETLFAMGGQSGTTGLIGLRNAGDNTINAFTKNSTDLAGVTLDVDPTADFHAYAIVYTSADQKVKVSVDGGEFSEAVSFTKGTDSRWQFAGIHGGQIAGFAQNVTTTTARFDDFKLYTTALTPALIQKVVTPFGLYTAEVEGRMYMSAGAAINSLCGRAGEVRLLKSTAEALMIPENVTIDAGEVYKFTGALTGTGTIKLTKNSSGNGSFGTTFGAGSLANFQGTVWINKGRYAADTALESDVKIKITDGGQLWATGGTWANAITVSGNGWSTGDAIESAAIRNDGATFSGTITTVGEGDDFPSIGTYNSTSSKFTGNIICPNGVKLLASASGGIVDITGEIKGSATDDSVTCAVEKIGAGMIKAKYLKAGDVKISAGDIRLNEAEVAANVNFEIMSGAKLTCYGWPAFAGAWSIKTAATITGVLENVGNNPACIRTGAFTKKGTGTITMPLLFGNGEGAYTGSIAVESGELIFGKNCNFDSTATISVASGATLSVANGITVDGTGSISIAAGGKIKEYGTSTVNGVLKGAGEIAGDKFAFGNTTTIDVTEGVLTATAPVSFAGAIKVNGVTNNGDKVLTAHGLSGVVEVQNVSGEKLGYLAETAEGLVLTTSEPTDHYDLTADEVTELNLAAMTTGEIKHYTAQGVILAQNATINFPEGETGYYAWTAGGPEIFIAKKTKSVSIKFCPASPTEGTIAATDDKVGGFPVAGIFWNHSKQYTNTGSATQELMSSIKDGQGNTLENTKVYYYMPNMYDVNKRGTNVRNYQTTGNGKLTYSYFDDSVRTTPSAWPYTVLTDQGTDYTIPRTPAATESATANLGWCVTVKGMPYQVFDLYIYQASDQTAESITLLPIAVKANNGDWQYFAGDNKGSTIKTTINATWDGAAYCDTKEMTEGKNYIRYRISRATLGLADDEEIETIYLSHPSRSTYTGRLGLAGVQIVEVENDGFYNRKADADNQDGEGHVKTNWTEAQTWLNSSGSPINWPTTKETAYVNINADTVAEITVNDKITADMVTVKNAADAQDASFKFLTLEPLGEVATEKEDAPYILNAPVDATGFHGDLYLQSRISGLVTLNSGVTVNFVANVAGEETTAYPYNFTGAINPIKKHGPGTFLVPSSMYNIPFNIQEGLIRYNNEESATLSGVLSGAGKVVKSGTGTLTMNVANTFTGGTIINGGTVILGAQNALGGSGKVVTVNDGGALDVYGKQNHGLVLTLNGGTLKNSGASVGRGNVQFNSISLDKDSVADLAADTGIIYSGWNATTLTLNNHTLTKRGVGDLLLCNVTADTGTIRIENGGIHVTGKNASYSEGNSNLSNVSLEIVGEGTQFKGNFAQTYKNLTFVENGSISQADGSTSTITITGKILGSSSIPNLTLAEDATVETTSGITVTGALTLGTSLKVKAVVDTTVFTLGDDVQAPASLPSVVLVDEDGTEHATGYHLHQYGRAIKVIADRTQTGEVYATDDSFTTFKLANGQLTELLENDVVVIKYNVFNNSQRWNIPAGKTEISGHNVKVDFVDDSSNNAATLSGDIANKTITVANGTVLFLRGNQTIGTDVTFAAEGTGQMKVTAGVTISGTVTITAPLTVEDSDNGEDSSGRFTLSEGAKLTVPAAFDANRIVSGVRGKSVAVNKIGDKAIYMLWDGETAPAIDIPEGTTSVQIVPGQTVRYEGAVAPETVKIVAPISNDGTVVDITQYFDITKVNGSITATLKDDVKPAATAIAMATPTVEEEDQVQFTITNPIPGLFYAVSSCDEPNGDFTSATGDQATSTADKTVSIPMTFTDGKKVKYYKVSVKATK